MMAQLDATTAPPTDRPSPEISAVYREGIVAGILGAAAVAVWFLILDTIEGRPLYTPTVLATAFFRQGARLSAAGRTPVSFELTLVYTWVHGLAFCLIGCVAARLLAMAERNPNLGFGVLRFGVMFEIGFLVVGMLFAEEILPKLAWQSILLGNFLAAAAMAGYFWRRHPNLTILP